MASPQNVSPPKSQPRPQLPDYSDRTGSMALRSNHMNYSRAILNSNWFVQATHDMPSVVLSHCILLSQLKLIGWTTHTGICN